MSQDETDGVCLSQRQHGDVQSSGDTVGCVDVETALQIQIHVESIWNAPFSPLYYENIKS